MYIRVSEAEAMSGAANKTIRNWVDDGKVRSKTEKGILLVNKTDVLLQYPTVLTLFNQKGGVGKTTTSVILADYYSRKGIKVLVIDMDPQGILSKTYFKYKELVGQITQYEFWERNTRLDKIIREVNENLHILPNDLRMTEKDKMDISDMAKKEETIRTVFDRYQIVIIDCPPALNAFSRFGIFMADYIIMPLLGEPYTYWGLTQAIEAIRTMKKFNPGLIDWFAIMSKHTERRTIIREDFEELFKRDLGPRLLESRLPETITVVERGVSGMNIFDMLENDAKKKVLALCEEVEDKIFEQREKK
jgi:chromosome partitioning protein